VTTWLHQMCADRVHRIPAWDLSLEAFQCPYRGRERGRLCRRSWAGALTWVAYVNINTRRYDDRATHGSLTSISSSNGAPDGSTPAICLKRTSWTTGGGSSVRRSRRPDAFAATRALFEDAGTYLRPSKASTNRVMSVQHAGRDAGARALEDPKVGA
jgi:hypothetical protein